MTVETFFEKFELFANASDAINKMRELVRTLAMRGELVGQSATDEPAAAFLVNAVSKLPPEKKRRLPASLGAVKEAPFVIPSGWSWARFQDVAFIASNLVDPKGYADAIHLAPDNIEKGTGTLLPCRTVREDKVKSGNHRFYAGQLVYSKIRPNLSKVVIVDFEGLCSADMYPIDPLIEPRYLLHYMLSQPFLAQAIKTDTRVAMPKINQEELNKIAVPVPPLAEQKRIVAKVDELMALCDRLEAQQKEREAKHAVLARAALACFAEASTPANLEYLFHNAYDIDPAHLRKSILAMAASGTLVPQDAKDQPARELLIALGEKRADLAKAQGVRLPKPLTNVSADDAPHDVPGSWEWCRIGQLALVIDYGTSQKADSNAANVPVYRMGNIVGGRVVNQNLKYVSAEIDDLPGLYLKNEDILFNRTNSYELVGKSGLYKGKDNAATFASYLIRIRVPSAFVLPEFVTLAMNAPYYRTTQIEPEVVQQCGQANFNGSKLSATVVPIPPLVEQRRIVAKVGALMALVDRLEAQLAESRTAAARLLEAVVAELTRPQPLVELKGRIANAGRFACYVLKRWRDVDDVGRTKLEKAMDFSQKHCGVALDRHDIRGKHGPVDYDLLLAAERWAGEHGGFATNDPGTGQDRVIYTPEAQLDARALEAETLMGDCKAEVDRILSLLAPLNAFHCGLRATAYTAWRDLLAKGEAPNDRDIIRDARHNWHDSKATISDTQWFKAIRWLEHHKIVPAKKP